jgi:hypothetical protein
MSTTPDNLSVTFPRGGTLPDGDGYPHYAAIGEANERFRAWYEGELAARRQARQVLLEPGPGDDPEAVRARWARRADQVRTGLAACLGLAISDRQPEPAPARFEFGVPISAGGLERGLSAGAASLAAVWIRVPAASWEDGDIEVLVLRPRATGEALSGLLLIPDAGPCLLGGESPEVAARRWGCALASAGMVVAIPRLPGYTRFSSTQNKWRLLEGTCVLGVIVMEAARALDALLEQPGVGGSRAWVGGGGVGGLAALMLGMLDPRVGGVLAAAPARWGTSVELQALIVPHSHPVTDLPELAALIAPRPLALVEPAEERSPFDAPLADLGELAHAAEPAYALLDVPDNLGLFPAGKKAEAIHWIQARSDQLVGTGAPTSWVVRGEKPGRRYAVTNYEAAEAWRGAAKALRREYREVAALPEIIVPLSVEKQSETRLEDCTREEYHVQTGTYSYANLTFLRPHGPVKPRTTILCLPGSSSDVARVESQYGHEVVAQGWNAAIIDARVALYPFHPGIAEDRAVVSQSLHDLLCVLDYVAKRKDVDLDRIGAMGLSQGGTHSWMVAAMDQRVAAAVSVCGVCTYRSLPSENLALGPGAPPQTYLDSHSIYYYTPGVLRIADQQDLCALIAPRPFALIGANRDNCFPLPGVRECARDLTHVYNLLGAEQNFRYIEFEGPHSMPLHTRKAAYAFFRQHLDEGT